MRIVNDRRGVVAVLVAIVLPIIIGFMGLGFDAVRGMLVQQRIQQSVDAASLAGASSLATEDERRTLAENVFASNYGTGFLAPPVEPVITFSNDGEITVTGSATFDTYFMRLFKTNSLEINASSRSRRALLDIEVALVVDISGSMYANAGNGMTRIEALRAAAADLVDIMEQNKPSGTRLRFAIVPYNVVVNIGTANTAYVTGTNHALFAGTNWVGCVQERAVPDHISDRYDSLATDSSGRWHAYIWPPEPNTPAGSCNNPGQGGNGSYETVDPEQAKPAFTVSTQGPNLNCPRQPIKPLTDNLTTVRQSIRYLYAAYNKGTVIAPGVSWGLRVLSPSAPFTEGAAYSPGTRKIMIVLTDGEQINDGKAPNCPTAQNSGTPYQFDPASFGMSGSRLQTNGPADIWTAYGYLEDSQPFSGLTSSTGVSYTGKSAVEQFDLLLIDACKAVKDAGAAVDGAIEVFTVTFGNDAGPSTSVSNAMRACATDDDHYQHAPNTNKLRDAFGDIAKQISKVRLSG
ncbi:MAG: hypothetical protein H6851_07790 [Geminicoccaceae bacterium]|nr:hypothetical protein [Geminicoccaceae bacterium]